MQQELRNNNWMRSLTRKITSAVHIEEFVSLWIRIQDVHLQQGVQDSITWRGPRMGLTPPARLTEFNSNARSSCSVLNSFGKHKWRTNARYSPGFWCKIKFLRRTTYKREGDHTKNTACCAIVPWKPASTYVYVALLLRRFGIKSSLGKT